MTTIQVIMMMAVVVASGDPILSLSSYFGDHMVIQRDSPFSVFGFSTAFAPAIRVDVVNGNGDVVATGGAATSAQPVSGSTFHSWAVFPQPTVSAGGPYVVSVYIPGGSSSAILFVRDVWFGDVFLCSGQSNMQFATIGDMNASDVCADTVNYPLLRVWEAQLIDTPTNPPDVQAQAPYVGAWGVATPQSICGPNWGGYFSAVCYLTGREIMNMTGGGRNGVAVGLIASAWGGTAIQVWNSPAATAECPTPAVPASPGTPTNSSQLYTTMVYPLANVAISAFVWYQGETNALLGGLNSAVYGCMFQALINDWRKTFLPLTSRGMNATAPFIYVELAATPANVTGNTFAGLRLEQATALQIPYVGRATALDLGDISSPYGSIHPRWKQAVGHRAALQYLKFTGELSTGTWADGPVVVSVSRAGDEVVLTFDRGPLFLNGTRGCAACCSTAAIGAPSALFQWVARVGAPRKSATIKCVSGQQITLIADSAAQYIGYALSDDFPQCLVFASGTDEPASPDTMLPASQFFIPI